MKIVFITLLLVFFMILPCYAQEDETVRQIILSPIVEVNSYNKEGVAIGFGFAAGTGDRLIIGIKPLFSVSIFGDDSFNTLEMTFFMRYFIFDTQPDTGLFAQLDFGAAVYFFDDDKEIPVEFGSVSIGIGAGWRITFKDVFYVEPYVRVGYPYAFGIGTYLGYKF